MLPEGQNVLMLSSTQKFVSLGGVDLKENGNSLEGFVGVGYQLVWHHGVSWQT